MSHLLTADNISNYIKNSEQPTDFKIVGCLHRHALIAVSKAPIMSSKKKYLWNTFEKVFLNVDWSDSFSNKLVILTNEDISPESIIELHYWLTTKCSNVKNIFLITSQNLGTEQWWENWCETMHEISFNVIDLAFDTFNKKFIDQINNLDHRVKLNEIKKHATKWFSFYGGTYQKNERDYLCLMLAANFYNVSVIDYIGKFATKDELLNYSERITKFCDQSTIDKLSRAYDQFVINNNFVLNFPNILKNNTPLPCEPINFLGLQWQIDKTCIFNIARETTVSDIYTGISEKTLRSFLHWKVLIPLGYNSVNLIKNLGFWFPEDIFDYSYQYEKDWHRRVLKIIDSLHKVMTQYTISDMIIYIENNKQNFLKNEQSALNFYTNRCCYLTN
jgi:hypothetical protein